MRSHPNNSTSYQNLSPQAQARVQLAGVDLLLVPTALHHYTLAEIEAQEHAPQVCHAVHGAVILDHPAAVSKQILPGLLPAVLRVLRCVAWLADGFS